jgi:hypothetical protein|tara:strand:+ start:891 stop:1934 length:1044 start_codon:yes stop_codon:yes gene_type:complete
MPIIGSLGAASSKGFGQTGGKKNIVSFDYLVVAGGGAGGGQGYGAGGGAGGGYRTSFPGGTKIEFVTGNNTITTGTGGTVPAPQDDYGSRGNNSEIVGDNFTITATGGGGGMGGPAAFAGGGGGPGASVMPGGSGGGASLSGPPFDGSPFLPGGVAQGNTPPFSPPQGNNGGLPNRHFPGSHPLVPSGGGGGGAGSAGSVSGPPYYAGPGGAGGNGAPNTIAPAYPLGTVFAGGGGGDSWDGPFVNNGAGDPGGAGGPGGGAPGGSSPPQPGTQGTDGLGGGGGGGQGARPNIRMAGDGGDGVVILRTPSASAPLITVSPGTNTKTTEPSSGDTICTFTVTGTLTIA